MKKVSILLLLIAMVGLSVGVAKGQLIIEDKLYKVVKVVPEKYHIEITGLDEDPNVTRGYIFIPGNVKCYKEGKPFDWRKLKKGWIIRVKGGLRWDLKQKAEKIWVVKF